MEKFVTVKKTKEKNTTVWLHSKKFENSITDSLDSNRITWLSGPMGCGKTAMANKIVATRVHFDATSYIYLPKNQGILTLDRVDPGSLILIDNVDKDNGKIGVIYDICDKYQNKFLIVSDHISTCTNVSNITMKAPSKTKVINYASQLIGSAKSLEIYQKFSGNFRNFMNAVECCHKFGMDVSSHDEFFDSNTTVKNLICKGGTGYKPYIGVGTEEHGHVIDMVASNYVTKDIESTARIIDSISISDAYDSHMYMGNWEFLPYLTHHGCVVPSKIMGNTLKPSLLHPGYVWTKYYNQCMRKKLLMAVRTRNPSMASLNGDSDFLIYLCSMLHNMDFDTSIALLREYGIKSCDLDLMNHLVSNKLKGKKLNILKKALKNDR